MSRPKTECLKSRYFSVTRPLSYRARRTTKVAAYDLLILMFNVLDVLDLDNLDDLDEGGGVDDLVRLGPLHHNLGAGHQRLAVHRGQAKPGQGDGWSESLIRKIKCFILFTGDLFHPVCGDKSIHVNPLLHGGLLCPSINNVWSLH